MEKITKHINSSWAKNRQNREIFFLWPLVLFTIISTNHILRNKHPLVGIFILYDKHPYFPGLKEILYFQNRILNGLRDLEIHSHNIFQNNNKFTAHWILKKNNHTLSFSEIYNDSGRRPGLFPHQEFFLLVKYIRPCVCVSVQEKWYTHIVP